MKNNTLAVHKAQYEFLSSKAINTGLVAGLGSGKSYIATLKTILIKIQNPTMRVAYYLPTVPLIKDIAFVKFPELLTSLGIEFELNKTDKEIHIKGYGSILFRSMSNPETIVGYEVYYSLIDEVDILPADLMETAFNKILARNRQKGSDQNRLDVVGTPEGFRFFYKRFVTEARDTDKLITARTYDNKHLPDGYIANLEAQYPPNLLEAYLNGKFTNLTTGTVYSYFNRDIHHSDIEDDGFSELIIGQDWNIGGCISIVYIKKNDTLIAIDEIVSYDTKSIIDNISNKYPKRIISIYPDASGNARKTSSSQTDIQMLRQAGFKVYVNSRNPMVKDRINITNNCFDKNIVKVNTAKCQGFTKALEQHSYNDKGEPEKFNGSGTVDDYTDAGTYPLAYLYPIVTRNVSYTKSYS